jgi:hypothetical protein
MNTITNPLLIPEYTPKLPKIAILMDQNVTLTCLLNLPKT